MKPKSLELPPLAATTLATPTQLQPNYYNDYMHKMHMKYYQRYNPDFFFNPYVYHKMNPNFYYLDYSNMIL